MSFLGFFKRKKPAPTPAMRGESLDAFNARARALDLPADPRARTNAMWPTNGPGGITYVTTSDDEVMCSVVSSTGYHAWPIKKPRGRG